MAAMSDFVENNFWDMVLRGQTWTIPANLHFALFTAAPSDSGGGTEVAGGSYARVSVARSLANFAGTQGAGTTVASTGTGGASSNNTVITFPSPTASWGTVTHYGLFDASTGGNLFFHGALTTARVINSGDGPISFAAAAFQLTAA
jgi:hypothetical protein